MSVTLLDRNRETVRSGHCYNDGDRLTAGSGGELICGTCDRWFRIDPHSYDTAWTEYLPFSGDIRGKVVPIATGYDGRVTFAKAAAASGTIVPITSIKPNDHDEVRVPMDATHIVCNYA